MNECMDEYLKSINVWAISTYNIGSYIRKNGKFACVLDVMALVMDREPFCLLNTLKYMLDTYPCKHSQVSFPGNDPTSRDKEIGMLVEDLIPFLCRIPGRETRYRLYKYAEPILKYLEGDQFLIQYILNAKEEEDENIIKKTKRKCVDDNYKCKIRKMREFELYIHEQTQFPCGYEPSPQFFAEIEEIKEKFYGKREVELDTTEVNEIRKEEVENFMYIEEAKKLKKTDEITFNQVIMDLGYEDDFFKRIKCYEYGGEVKKSKGHKRISKKGRDSVYVYTDEDLEDMKEIVKKVYDEF